MKYIYSFFDSVSNADRKNIGNKGFGLIKMTRLKLPVPPGFIISSEICVHYLKYGRFVIDSYKPHSSLMSCVNDALKDIEKKMKRKFNDEKHPLLLSVRSSSLKSMPGMLSTILNVRLEDLWENIEMVFKSWNNERTKLYRKVEHIPNDLGTAVIIQAMVFGNLNNRSGTGVLFTRNPSSGDNKLFGEYLINAQGEDVVSGKYTGIPINDEANSLEYKFESVYKQLKKASKLLEHHFKDMLDIEFTFENLKLWILQCRIGERTSIAAIKIIVDMYEEHLINHETVLKRMKSDYLLEAKVKQIITQDKPIARGLPVGQGAVTGIVALTPKTAIRLSKRGKQTILVRKESSPKDTNGMYVSRGILTSEGGSTSHAAVVARKWKKCCIVGCSDIKIKSGYFEVKGKRIYEGDVITLDGNNGFVYEGKQEIQEVIPDKISYKKIMKLLEQK